MTNAPVPAPPIPAPPRPQLPRGFHGWARATQAALLACVVYAAVEIGQLLAQRDLLTRVQGNAASASFSDVVDAGDRASTMRGLWLVLLLATGIIWLVWWGKAYGAAAEHRDLRYSPRWAIGGWFVPFASLVVPKRVADDLWTAAKEPHRAPGADVERSGLVVAWWSTWLIAGFLVLAIRSDDKTVDDVLAENAVRVVQLLVYVAAAVLAIAVVGRITAGFEARAGVEARARRSSKARAALVVGAVVVVFATVAVSTAAFTIDSKDVAGEPIGHHMLRFTPDRAHYSVAVPDTWLVMASEDLPDGVTFAASEVDGNTAVSIVEGPSGAALGPDQMREQIATQFDLLGDVEQTSVALPGGDAMRYSFTALQDGTMMEGRFYVFTGADYDHVLVVATPSDLALDDTGTIGRIARTFRTDDGQRA